MAKNTVDDWDTTAGNNTDLAGTININEGWAASSINNAIREMMAQVATHKPVAAGAAQTLTGAQKTQARSNIGFAIGTAIDDDDVDASDILTLPTDGNTFAFTGTQTVDAIATYGVGQTVRLIHGSTRIFTHHATNLICPGGVDLVTASGDISEWQEYASGDWRCVGYLRAVHAGGGRSISSQAMSGTSVSITGIPAWVTEFKLALYNVSTNGSSQVIVQLGDSGGAEATGYVGAVANILASSAANDFNTVAFYMPTASATATRYGIMTFTLLNRATNLWAMDGTVIDTTNNVVGTVSGIKALSATLDRVVILTASGTESFDSGTAYLIY